MAVLLHLVQRGGAWAGCSPTQSPPRCTKCNSPPINGQCTNFLLFDVAMPWRCPSVCLFIYWSVANAYWWWRGLTASACVDDRASSVSSHEPAVSTAGLGSESSAGSVVSDEPVYRPQFTMEQQHGLCVYDWICRAFFIIIIIIVKISSARFTKMANGTLH